MKFWRALILAVILAFLLISSSECGWYNYTAADGLASNAVRAIVEDRAGNLWFGLAAGGFGGLAGGVSRYDGVAWHTFRTADGLASNDVRAILEDSSGNLWFGTSGGVSRYDGESWTTFTTADGLVSDNVSTIVEDSGGDLWFGTYGGGLSRYDGESWTTFTTADGLASNSVWAILEDSSGNLWFGTYGGVSRYDGENWTTFTTADGLESDQVFAVFEDSSGNFWFGTYQGGVSRYDGESWVTFRETDGLSDDNIWSIFEDSSGNLWFGTYYRGVSRYDGQKWCEFTTSDGLAGDVVRAIIEDSSGNLWFGTGYGVSRYDGEGWLTFTTADGLAADDVHAILEDSSGNLWFGTDRGGVSRYDGEGWLTFTTADGLAGNTICAIEEDSSGNLWFGTGYGVDGGVSRYDGVSWVTFTTADGLASNCVWAILEDSSGNLWFGTDYGGVSRYDGENWVTFTTSDGLAGHTVRTILEDSCGNLWFGTSYGGVSCYDGVSWVTFRQTDGLVSSMVYAIEEDSSGNLWFGTYRGVSRYDGENWTTFRTTDGLAVDWVDAIEKDSSGNLWFGTHGGGVSHYDGEHWVTLTSADGLASNSVKAISEGGVGSLWFGGWGVTRHDPDRVSPQTVISPRPPELSASTASTITFAAAFREVEGIVFSYSFDGAPWSQWSPADFYQVTDLCDGEHIFMVRARDRMGNTDSTPAVCTFEIDATPPAPVIAFPTFGLAVRESIDILGTAADLRFEKYHVEVRPEGAVSWNSLVESASPVTGGILAGWNTVTLPDGVYELRLSVRDTLGLTGAALASVVVDNHAPWAHETAPAVVSTARGGDVYTTDGRVHLYFPPHAFALDAEVDITALPDSLVPDTLAGGAACLIPGYEISWEGVSLEKPATLEMSYPSGPQPLPDGTLSFYVFGADSSWQRLGGTVEGSVQRMSSPITELGKYAVFVETAVVPGSATLSPVSLTPRVFSPRGSFAREEVGIGFTLGRSGSVTVKIYNRAGRLVREVVSGEFMGAGTNLVRWDGRDADGGIVVDGLYLISVEALGEKQVKTIAVVR